MTVCVLILFMITTGFDIDAYMRDLEPYTKQLSGTINPKTDFDDLAQNYYKNTSYVPYLRVEERSYNAKADFEKFKKYLKVEFTGYNNTYTVDTDLCLS